MAAESEAPPVRARVISCTIAREHLCTRMVVGLLGAATTGRLLSVALAESGPYLDSGRNKVLAHAFAATTDPPWDWALFIDSDIEFTPGHIDTLFAPTLHATYDPATYPIIGGVYINPFDDGMVDGEEPDSKGNTGQFGPVVYEWGTRDDLPGELNGIATPIFVRMSRKTLADLPAVEERWNPWNERVDRPVAEVSCIGTGFLAIHRDFLVKMAEEYGQPLPWFEEPVRDGVHYGEDMGFALRVKDMGYPVLVNRACTVLHHKTIKLL